MGSFLKQAAMLLLGNMAGSNHKANFVVHTLRVVYVGAGSIIIIAYYSAYRNERVESGSIKFPFPFASKMKRQFSPDRPEKELPHPQHEEWGTSLDTKKAREALGPISFTGVPQTAAEAKKLAGIGQFQGTPVAKWIIPYLAYAKAHGWRGSVTSGYRTYAEQLAIWNSGVRPAAKPGTSNHEGKVFPRGAVDVSEAEQLSQILEQIPGGSLLKWAGAADPVHFSHPHNGSY